MDEWPSLLPLIPFFGTKPISVSPIKGGLTNRNYRIDTDDGAFVLRIGGAYTDLLGIDREREVACARVAAGAGFAPEVIAYLPEERALVTRFVPGRLLAAGDAKQPAMLGKLAATLRRTHQCSVPHNLGSFSPFGTVRQYHALATARKVPFPPELDHALTILSGIETALATTEPPCLCHNDLLPTNFIDAGESMQLIDWEYAGLGDRFFDLGNLAANFELDADGEAQLLAGYFGSATLDHLRRLRLMRRASDMRESLWGYLQAGISRLYTPDYYLDYGKKHLDRFLAASSQGV